MNKRVFLLLMFILCIPALSYATENISGEIIYLEDEYIYENDMSDGYDYEYDDSYSYSSFDTYEDDSVPLSLRGKVIEASEVFNYNTGYYSYLAQKVKVEITDKQYNGEVYEIIYGLEDDYNVNLPLYPELKVNDQVYVYANFQDGELLGEASIQYYDKTNWLFLVVAIFAGMILLIGGKKGLKALIGLIITIGLIFTVLIPGILNGFNPVWITIGVCSITIFTTFIIVSGFSKKTIGAICGTIAGVIAAGVMGLIFSNLMRLDGVNEDARQLSVSIEEGQEMFDFKGIMLAGIMISALGACMDVGMSIASSISELKKENPEMTTSKLIKSGMNIGRDVMGTMTNTLILAYVGSTMLCILLYITNGFTLSDVLNRENVTMDILNSLVGSIGLVCTIPLTALISGLIMGMEFEKKKKYKHKEDEEEVKIRYFNG